jgi:hypothetical protein
VTTSDGFSVAEPGWAQESDGSQMKMLRRPFIPRLVLTIPKHSGTIRTVEDSTLCHSRVMEPGTRFSSSFRVARRWCRMVRIDNPVG